MNELTELFIWSYGAGIVSGVGLVIITMLLLEKKSEQ